MIVSGKVTSMHHTNTLLVAKNIYILEGPGELDSLNNEDS